MPRPRRRNRRKARRRRRGRSCSARACAHRRSPCLAAVDPQADRQHAVAVDFQHEALGVARGAFFDKLEFGARLERRMGQGDEPRQHRPFLSLPSQAFEQRAVDDTGKAVALLFEAVLGHAGSHRRSSRYRRRVAVTRASRTLLNECSGTKSPPRPPRALPRSKSRAPAGNRPRIRGTSARSGGSARCRASRTRLRRFRRP